MSRKSAESLRCGFTTGAVSTAAGVAAYRLFSEHKLPKTVTLLFPDNKVRKFAISLSESGVVQVIKDAGDDPDITDKVKIRAEFSQASFKAVRDEDYLLKVGCGELILRGGEGVGLCRRRGLDCDEGRWAINKVPREMIRKNLELAGFGRKRECGLLEISVVNGRQLARRTLNAKLGIENGISILGTSGIVYPYSHKAYIKTVAVLVRAVAEMGAHEVVLTTGGRTLRAAAERLPHIPEEAFIRIGDFICASLEEVEKTRRQYPELKRVTVACMPGKLCKYAAGFSYTHAASVTQTMTPLVEIVDDLSSRNQELAGKVAESASVRQALTMLPEKLVLPVLESLSDRALMRLRNWAPTSGIRLLLYDFSGKLLLERT